MNLEKIKSAINLAKSGDKQSGKQLLIEVLKSDPQNEQAWLWLSACVDTLAEKKYCLEKVLAINPNNQDVLKALQSISNRQQVIDNRKEMTLDGKSTSAKSHPSTHAKQISPPNRTVINKAKRPVNMPLLLGGIGLFLICIIGAVLLGANVVSLFKPFDSGSNPIITSQQTPTPTISNEEISSQILNYYQNTLNLSVDLSSRGFGVVPLPAKDHFQVSNITVVDKSISGNEAIIIARMTFTIIDMPPMDSPGWEALLKYFGDLNFVKQTFEQERKFLFQRYESGAWKLEREPDIETP
jgi:hypothetical protein